MIFFKLSFLRLEQDIKKLKADLQASRQIEQELRSQISSLTNTERGIRSEIGQLRQENELLQNKYVFLQLWQFVADSLVKRYVKTTKFEALVCKSSKARLGPLRAIYF